MRFFRAIYGLCQENIPGTFNSLGYYTETIEYYVIITAERKKYI